MTDRVQVIWDLDEKVDAAAAGGMSRFAGPLPDSGLRAVPRNWPRGVSRPRPLIRPSLLEQLVRRAAPAAFTAERRARLRRVLTSFAKDTEAAWELIGRLRDDPQVDPDSIDTITGVRFQAPLTYAAAESWSQGYLDDEMLGGIGLAAFRGLPGWMGEDVTVAVVEGGWQLPHPDLPESIQELTVFGSPVVGPPSADMLRHGNSMLGVLVGQRNHIGIDGIVPRAQVALVPYGRIGDADLVQDYNIFDAIATAIAHLLGAEGGVLVLAADAVRQEFDADGAVLMSPRLPLEAWPHARELFKGATEQGVHVVIAAGNGYGAVVDDHCTQESYPSGALVIGGARSDEKRIHPSSNRGGTRVDLHSWGHRVATCTATGYTDGFNGTSSATAIVAGVVALLASHVKSRSGKPLTPPEMRRLLVETGYWDIPGIGPRPSLAAALRRLQEVDYEMRRL